MTFEQQLWAGCFLPVRGAGHCAGWSFSKSCLFFFGGGGTFSDIKGVLLGGSFNCYESGF